MAKTKAKPKEMFDDIEEYTDQEIEEEQELHEEPLPEDIDDSVILAQAEEEPVPEIISLEEIATEETGDLDEEEDIISPAVTSLPVRSKVDIEELPIDEEENPEEIPQTGHIVVKCPHCQEEVLDVDNICPLCGNPLRVTADSIDTLRDEESPLLEFSTDTDEERNSMPDELKGGDDDLFRGLLYRQDDYPPISDI